MKRLIVCCDGTWQDLESSYPSNVVKIAQAIEPVASDGIPQVVFYDAGIGTEGGIIDSLMGGGFGKGIDQNIQDGYRFLCLNYSPGDEIYLFGFSRGAYTVRSLAGLMYNSGLLARSHICQASKAYELYRHPAKPDNPKMEDFRQKHGFNGFKTEKYGDPFVALRDRVPITLLACFDTVGSLGIPNQWSFLNLSAKVNAKYQFHDCKLSPIIQNALHAVAIDEPKESFAPTLMEKSQRTDEQKLIQKWFPGNHGCVGGGTEEQRGLSDGTLQWMIDSIKNIKELGLSLEINPKIIPTGVNFDPKADYNAEPTDILNKFTMMMGTKPRDVSDNFEDLHESVKIRWQSREDYRPANLHKHGDSLNK